MHACSLDGMICARAGGAAIAATPTTISTAAHARLPTRTTSRPVMHASREFPPRHDTWAPWRTSKRNFPDSSKCCGTLAGLRLCRQGKKGAATQLRRCRDGSDGDVEGEAVTRHGGGRVGGRVPEQHAAGSRDEQSEPVRSRFTTEGGTASRRLWAPAGPRTTTSASPPRPASRAPSCRRRAEDLRTASPDRRPVARPGSRH
mgnify:CR=1 FL=1